MSTTHKRKTTAGKTASGSAPHVVASPVKRTAVKPVVRKVTAKKAVAKKAVAKPAAKVVVKPAAKVAVKAAATRAKYGSADQKITVHDGKGEKRVLQVPTFVLPYLQSILKEIELGNKVSLIPMHAELTTQEAADVLNVSRPYFVQLLEQGKMPFHKIGTHRRVSYAHVLEYKKRIDAKRDKALQFLVDQAQELNMGY